MINKFILLTVGFIAGFIAGAVVVALVAVDEVLKNERDN